MVNSSHEGCLQAASITADAARLGVQLPGATAAGEPQAPAVSCCWLAAGPVLHCMLSPASKRLSSGLAVQSISFVSQLQFCIAGAALPNG